MFRFRFSVLFILIALLRIKGLVGVGDKYFGAKQGKKAASKSSSIEIEKSTNICIVLPVTATYVFSATPCILCIYSAG